jgi:oxygen-independent coproporphyrinogen-3 oxidase
MITDQAPTGLYLHIPYCRHLCGYCAFAKTDKGAFSEKQQIHYLKALEKEFELQQESINASMETLYIGGGTPSRLSQTSLNRLLNFLNSKLKLENFLEKTFEVNPEDLIERPDLLNQLQDHGINRVSMGIQTFQERGIQVLERKTTATQNLEAMELLFSNFKGRVSIDLILGWPNQSLACLEHDLELLSKFPVGHYSTYLLNYEPGTRLERDRKKGRIQCLDEDSLSNIWEAFQSFCKHNGYNHYEISSFCLDHQESLHNTSTWEGYPYLGLGAGAVSRLKTSRWTNLKNPEQYIEHCLSGRSPKFETENITSQMHWEEDLLLSLRHNKGLNLVQFQNQHGLDLKSICSEDLQLGQQQGAFKIIQDHLFMTPKGWQLFDHWISNWMLKLEDFIQMSAPKRDA